MLSVETLLDVLCKAPGEIDWRSFRERRVRNHQKHVWQTFLNDHALNEVRSQLGDEWCTVTPPVACAGLGQIAVTFTAQDRYRPSAAEAMILPTRWIDSSTSISPPGKLPQQIVDLSLEVRDRFLAILPDRSPATIGRLEQASLAWAHPDWEGCDFSELQVSPASAVAPLLIALESFYNETLITHDFLASGCYNFDTHKWNVGGLDTKIIAAVRLGFRRFAVPRSNRSTVNYILRNPRPTALQQEMPGESAVADLKDGPDLLAAIEDAKNIAGHRPGPETSYELRHAWHKSRSDDRDARKYYMDCLLKDTAERVRQQHPAAFAHKFVVSDLVTILGPSYELFFVTSLLFSPLRIHLFMTDDHVYEDVFPLVREGVHAYLPHATKICVYLVKDDETCIDEIRNALSKIYSEGHVTTDSGHFLVDTTPGRRGMSQALTADAPSETVFLTWWNTTFPGTGRPDPLSIKPLLWRQKGPPQLEFLS